MTLSMGTNGVRALFDELGPQAAMDLGFGFAHFVKAHAAKNTNAKGGQKAKSKSKNSPYSSLPAVALARDMRITSPCLFEATASGLMEGGAQVLDLGILTAPGAEWTAHNLQASGLIIVTASHNPPEWNALKFVDANGVAVSRERGESIPHYIHKPHHPVPDWSEMGKTEAVPNVIPTYSQAIRNFLNRPLIAKPKHTRKLSVIADPGNGTSTLIAPDLFRQLGVKLKVINEKLDGHFPNRPSEPAEANVQTLIKTVVEQGADFGVAWDGDADRVTFVDDKGRWISGDMGVALSAKWALLLREKELKKNKGRNGRNRLSTNLPPIVVTTSATSRVVEEVAKEFGAITEYTDVGAPYLSERVHQLGERVIMAGEEVGGIVWPTFSLAKDGVLAAGKLLEMTAYAPLSEWVDELPEFHNSKLKLACPPGVNQRLSSRLAHELKSHLPDNSILRPLKGGFRLDFESSWVLIRASGTENYVRVFAEAPQADEAESLAHKYHALAGKRLRELDMI